MERNEWQWSLDYDSEVTLGLFNQKFLNSNHEITETICIIMHYNKFISSDLY